MYMYTYITSNGMSTFNCHMASIRNMLLVLAKHYYKLEHSSMELLKHSSENWYKVLYRGLPIHNT